MRAVLLAMLIGLVAATMLASTAKASRAPTGAERKAVARAFDPGYPDRCLFIRISTKGPYAGILNVATSRRRATAPGATSTATSSTVPRSTSAPMACGVR